MAEAQSVFLEKKTYIKLKKLADKNECSVNEEVAKAITQSYQTFDPALLDEIDVIPQKEEVFVVFPEEIYSVLEESAEGNATDVDDELILIFGNYLSEDDIEYESIKTSHIDVESESDEAAELEESEEDEDEYAEEYGYEEEYDDEEEDEAYGDDEDYSGEEDY